MAEHGQYRDQALCVKRRGWGGGGVGGGKVSDMKGSKEQRFAHRLEYNELFGVTHQTMVLCLTVMFLPVSD